MLIEFAHTFLSIFQLLSDLQCNFFKFLIWLYVCFTCVVLACNLQCKEDLTVSRFISRAEPKEQDT